MIQLKFNHQAKESPTTYFLNNSPFLTVGEYSYIGDVTISIYDTFSQIQIGRYCAIANEVEFVLVTDHPHKSISQYPFKQISNDAATSTKTFSIGNDVWIGRGVKLVKHQFIGDGAVVGAYSVVARNIEAYSINVGNPVRKIKNRFSAEYISAIRSSEWWNWHRDEILSNIDLLTSEPLSIYDT